MKRLDHRILEWSLGIYITLVILNSIKISGIITSIGSVGKLLFCIIFISAYLIFGNKKSFKITFLQHKVWLTILALLSIFFAYHTITAGTRVNLLPNIAFPIYFVFYYLIVKLFIRVHRKVPLERVREVVLVRILSIFRTTLFYNFIVWFVIALGLGTDMFEIDGGFGGFFQDEIHFGFYVVTGFLICFFFRYHQNIRDRSLKNTIMIFTYGGMALFTSRNALLIILISVLFYFIMSRVENSFLRTFLFTNAVLLSVALYLTQGMTEEEIIQITSGRYQIWLFAFAELFATGLLLVGFGLFNLNDIVLRDHKGIGFYYLDSLDTLSFHNSYVELIAGGGIIVVICFFTIISKTWSRLSLINKSLMIGILVGATFESFLVQPFILIAILLYFILICNNVGFKFRNNKVDTIPDQQLAITSNNL